MVMKTNETLENSDGSWDVANHSPFTNGQADRQMSSFQKSGQTKYNIIFSRLYLYENEAILRYVYIMRIYLCFST